MELPVRNIVSEIDLKPSDALLPLFESVVNAIHSLKLTRGLKNSEKKIQVQVIRDNSENSTLFQDKIISFKVIDNGEGFIDANLKSFKTAYSRKNKELGCKGIGRFTILAGYERVSISSIFNENGQWKYREIQFDTDEEVKIIKEEGAKENVRKTSVELINVRNVIRDYMIQSVNDIATALMEHCLVYYLCGDMPSIEVLDIENNIGAVVNDLYKSLSKEREKDFPLGKETFKYYITKSIKTTNRKNHYIHYCANSRVVGGGKSIARVNGIFAYPLIANGNGYFLDIYVVSDYLNRKVFSARNGFDIPQDKENTLFNNAGEICFTDIEIALGKQLEDEYDEFVKETQDRNVKEVKDYIQTKAPRFKRFISRPEILNSIPPNLSDDKKEEYLYKLSFNERKAIDSRIQKFIDEKNINEETITIIKQELINKTAYDSDCFADYMFRRKAIIDVFNRFLEADKDGKYKLEEDIHNLIFPMGLSLDRVDYESHNLWMLDERFATYSFIDSDKPITSVSQKKSNKEPDILMVDHPNMFNNPISFSSEPW